MQSCTAIARPEVLLPSDFVLILLVFGGIMQRTNRYSAAIGAKVCMDHLAMLPAWGFLSTFP
jgi:hypothetical protein